ncbi:MAG TPA: histidine kinase dimerization/phospho-acceptor domain-containing protein, partial [Ktedonobacterales bacterium]|nr:histidine kinase dimerization/phospho-acceptor domain-containing protein [Ktedonobacterales bacterium]
MSQTLERESAPTDTAPSPKSPAPARHTLGPRETLATLARSAMRWGRRMREGLSLRSLTVQLAFGSVLIALITMITVAVVGLVDVRVAINNVERTQVVSQTQQLATAMGQSNSLTTTLDVAKSLVVSQRRLPYTVWVMDPSGKLLFSPTSLDTKTDSVQAQQDKLDAPAIEAALRAALRGQPQEITLQNDIKPPFAQRYCAAAPIHAGGQSNGRITGAVALADTSQAEHPPVARYTLAAENGIFTALLIMIGVAVLLGVLFSLQVTRPLTRLRLATARMARGDYATRVQLGDPLAPNELRALGASFNEMAAALERDVNELRRQEQLRRELLANISHELATPLTSIQGYNESLMDGLAHDARDREETTRLIALQASRLRRLVDQLRQVALYEGGVGQLTIEPLQLAPFVDEALAVVAPEYARKGVTLTSEVPSDLPSTLADSDRLTEILLNLLDNALRATPPGGMVRVAATYEPDVAKPQLRVSVEDTGSGVALAERE